MADDHSRLLALVGVSLLSGMTAGCTERGPCERGVEPPAIQWLDPGTTAALRVNGTWVAGSDGSTFELPPSPPRPDDGVEQVAPLTSPGDANITLVGAVCNDFAGAGSLPLDCYAVALGADGFLATSAGGEVGENGWVQVQTDSQRAFVDTIGWFLV